MQSLQEAKGNLTTRSLIPRSLPAEWRMLKNRSFLGSLSQQNIRSQQRPRIQELGNLCAPDSLRLEEGYAFNGFPLTSLFGVPPSVLLPLGGRVPGSWKPRGEKQDAGKREKGPGNSMPGERNSAGKDLVTQFGVLFLLSPEKPHLNLWLEAPDLLLAEIDLPKLVSA